MVTKILILILLTLAQILAFSALTSKVLLALVLDFKTDEQLLLITIMATETKVITTFPSFLLNQKATKR